jgi:hypothetical protein
VAGTELWTAGIAAAAALSGVFASVAADGLKDRRRIRHEHTMHERQRRTGLEDRRRTFELENLQVAYDSIWLLAREQAKIHAIDRRAAETTDHGYGGALLPDSVETDISKTSQAVKAIRLILDDEVRRLALEAQAALNHASMLGVTAKIFNRGPVTVAEGDAANADAAFKTDAAMNAISDRIRALMLES